MRFNDAVFGIVLLIFAFAVIAYSQSFPATFGQRYGPDLFPSLIAAGLAVCGLLLTLKGWAARRKTPWFESGEWSKDWHKRVTFALVPLALVFYILFSEFLGFLPTAILILFLLLRRFSVRPLAALGIACVTSLVIHTIFARFLLVPLPWGLLQPIAW